LARELLAHRDQAATEELSLVDPDHLGLVRMREHVLRGAHRARRNAQLAV
jgi:hypothetical protein